MSAPTMVGTPVANVNASTMNVSLPAGAAAGDLGLIWVFTQDQVLPGTTGTSPKTINASDSGWTNALGAGNYYSTGGAYFVYLFWRRLDGSALDSPRTGDSGVLQAYIAAVVRGVLQTGTPFEVMAGTNGSTSGSNVATITGVTTTDVDELIIGCFGLARDSNTQGWGATWTDSTLDSMTGIVGSATNTGNGISTGGFYGTKATAGDTGSVTNTTAVASTVWEGIRLAVLPAVAAPVDADPVTLKWDLAATPVATISDAGGNWNDTAAWVDGVVPDSTYDVKATATSGNLTINVAASCHNFDLTGYTGTLTHNAVTLSVYGSTFKLVAGMTYSIVNKDSGISFLPTGTVSVWTGGKTLGTFSVSTGTVVLQDNLKASYEFGFSGGTFDSNGKSMEFRSLFSDNNNTRTMYLRDSQILIHACWQSGSHGGLTFDAGTSQITFDASTYDQSFYFHGLRAGQGLTFYDIVFQPAAGSGENNSFELGSGTPTPSSCRNFTIGSAAYKNTSVYLAAGNFNVTGTLTIQGNSAVNRLMIYSSTFGTARTLGLSSTPTLTNVDFRDITLSGAGAPYSGTSLGDCQGNTGITFDTPTTQTWNGNATGNWSNAANWTSRVPLPQDTAAVPSLTSGTITVDMPRWGGNIDFSGSSGGSLVFSFQQYLYGSLFMADGVSFTGTPLVGAVGRGTYTVRLKSGGGTNNFIWYAGDWTLDSDLYAGGDHDLYNGATLRLNGYTYASNIMRTGGSSAHLYFGAGTLRLNGGICWQLAGTTNIHWDTGTLEIAGDSTNSGIPGTIGNLTLSNTGTFAFAAADYTISGTLTISGCGASKVVKFPSTKTVTMAALVINSDASHGCSLRATTDGSAAKLSSGITQSWDYTTLQDLDADGAGIPWYAGANSTITSNVTDILCQAPPELAPVDADPVSLKWDICNPVSASASALKWDLRSAVSATSLTAKWDLRAGVSAASRALKWDLRSAVSSTANSLKWDLYAWVVGQSLELRWDLNAAVDSAASTLIWDLRGAISSTAHMLWDLRAVATGAAQTLKWDMCAASNATVRSLKWDLRSAINAAVRTLIWDLLSAVAPTVTLLGESSTRLSDETGKDVVTVTFQSDQPFVEWQIRDVASGTADHTQGLQLADDTGTFAADTPIDADVTYAELVSVGDTGDGDKTVKVFVKDAGGQWSS